MTRDELREAHDLEVSIGNIERDLHAYTEAKAITIAIPSDDIRSLQTSGSNRLTLRPDEIFPAIREALAVRLEVTRKRLAELGVTA